MKRPDPRHQRRLLERPPQRQRNADFERGISHGIAIAMLSAGLGELKVEGKKYILWSYTHQLSSHLHDMHGTQTYRIKVLPSGSIKQEGLG